MACYDVWFGDGAADKMTGGGTGVGKAEDAKSFNTSDKNGHD